MKMYSIFKNHKVIASAAVLTVLSLVLAFSGAPGATSASEESGEINLISMADSGSQTDKRIISVSASGKVEVSPDIAYVTVGVLTESDNAKTAQQQNAEYMEKVVNAIKGSGVSEKDIKTTNYSISPKHSYIKETGTSVIIGYSVTNQAQVTVRDVNKAGGIIDIAAANGANMASNISFSIADYEKVYNDALRQAVNNAEARARTIAGAIGVSIGAPASVTESGGYYAPEYRYDYSSAIKAEGASTPISSGTFTVTSTVSMTFTY